MEINEVIDNTAAITEFNGLKIRNNAGASDFVDMQNLDSHEYPYFSTRRKNYYLYKGDYGMPGNASGVTDDMHGWCAYDTDFYYVIKRGNNLQVEKLGAENPIIDATTMQSKSAISSDTRWKDYNRIMIVMGGDIVIYPDWIKYNIKENKTYSLKKYFSIDSSYVLNHPTETANVFMCNEDGNDFAEYKSTVTATMEYEYACSCNQTGYFTSGDPKTWANSNGRYFFQFEGQGNQKKGSVSKYYTSSAMWMLEDEYCYIELSYGALGYASFNDLKNALTEINFEFDKELDITLKASGISSLFEGKINGDLVLHKIKNNNNTYVKFIFKGLNVWNTTWTLYPNAIPDTSNSYLAYQSPTSLLDIAGFTLENELYNQLDYIVQEGNRLFACSSNNHEIYASKLGDPSAWKEFKGISTDSYAATVGSPGKFTGAAVFNNTPIFFKENCIHRITGNTPSSFNISYDYYDGIKDGCSNSIVRVGNYLIYYSKGGFVYYTGNQPERIDRQLGDKRYRSIFAGEKEGHYIAAVVEQGSNKNYILDFDMDINQWYKHKDNNPRTFRMINVSNDLYTFHKEKCADYTSENNLLHTFIECIGRNLNENQNDTIEGDFEWYAESGWLIKENTNKKYITKLLFKMHLDPMAEISIYLKCDYNDEWFLVKSYSNTDDFPKTVSVSVIPQRCETMQYRIEGKGKTIIYSITYDISEGSEL